MLTRASATFPLFFILAACGGDAFAPGHVDPAVVAPEGGGDEVAADGADGAPDARPEGGNDGSRDAGGDEKPTAEAGGEASANDAGDGGFQEAGSQDGGIGDVVTLPESSVDAGPCDGGAAYAHDDGIGQSWQDCVPAGTYDQQEATAACEASGASSCAVNSCGGGGNEDVCGCGVTALGCVCWGFEGQGAGRVLSDVSQPACAGPNDWKWQ